MNWCLIMPSRIKEINVKHLCLGIYVKHKDNSKEYDFWYDLYIIKTNNRRIAMLFNENKEFEFAVSFISIDDFLRYLINNVCEKDEIPRRIEILDPEARLRRVYEIKHGE